MTKQDLIQKVIVPASNTIKKNISTKDILQTLKSSIKTAIKTFTSPKTFKEVITTKSREYYWHTGQKDVAVLSYIVEFLIMILPILFSGGILGIMYIIATIFFENRALIALITLVVLAVTLPLWLGWVGAKLSGALIPWIWGLALFVIWQYIQSRIITYTIIKVKSASNQQNNPA